MSVGLAALGVRWATVMGMAQHVPSFAPAAESRPAPRPLPSAEQLRKLPPDGGPEFNRLVFEKSPYLLQHARNPVNWFPWCDAAFEQARKEDKPVFLSIGYSTCHWCHVMEHESFEDPDVARLLNDGFICIKVDREERPDIDHVYMSVCQTLTGSGGWPLTVVMTPDKKPFFAGTYFSKSARFGRQGLVELLPRLGNAWRTQREKVTDSAEKIVQHVQSVNHRGAGPALDAATLTTGYRQLADRFDAARGGFGAAPKFPTPHNLTFLLRYWRRTGDANALKMVEQTLRAMRAGGMYDHVGFGFHRYSTDAEWLVPHFEKMLYDQALLIVAYIEAFQATQDAEFAQTAREILTYVLRDMTAPEGAFYSAEDADSEGVEGKFYLWTADELHRALGEDDANLVGRALSVKAGGNFTNPHTPPRTNILYRSKTAAELARELGIEEAELARRLEAARRELFAVREQRVHPHKDDKILTDWNGLMIAALAKAARALDEPKYAAAAQRSADFVLERLRDSHGRLLKRFRDGEAGLPAHLDDYAFLVWGLLELYEANFEVRNLQAALDLNKEMLRHYWDETASGLFFTADDGEALLARTKEVYDGALPSGNSVAMLNLLRLARITGDSELETKAAAIGQAFSADLSRAPAGHTQLLGALDFALGPSFEIVIAGDPARDDTREMLRTLRGVFLPNAVVLLRPDGDAGITRIAEFTQSQTAVDGKATAYVCVNQACQAPTTDRRELAKQLTPRR
ncbi:MAG: thioredoxin domain-containing protein [Planctomycetota bacterium]